MIQPQIAEYAKSQFKLGVGRDQIKRSLIEVGWKEADIEDSLNSAEGKAPASLPQPAKGLPEEPQKKPVQEKSIGAKIGEKSKEPPSERSISVSDLVAGSDLKTVKGAKEDKSAEEGGGLPQEKERGSSAPAKIAEIKPAAKKKFKLSLPKFGKTQIVIIALAVVAAAAAGGAALFYLERGGLKEELAALRGSAEGAGSQVASLESQVAELNGQISSLSEENRKLKTALSLFVAPAGEEEGRITIRGVIRGEEGEDFEIGLVEGVTVAVVNSSDESVEAALRPLVGSEAEISGAYLSGSLEIEVSAVNGASVEQE